MQEPTSPLSGSLSGIWLPLVTPFRDGELDEASVRRLVAHYGNLPVDGLILAATTGEGMTLGAEATARLLAVAEEQPAGRRPLRLGLSGSEPRDRTVYVYRQRGYQRLNMGVPITIKK